QGIHRIPVDTRDYPLIIQHVGDRTLMRAINRESALGILRGTVAVVYIAVGSITQRDFRYLNRTQLVAVTVFEFTLIINHLMHKLIHKIGEGAGVHPAGGFVKTLVNKELTPGRSAISVQTFFADQMVFTTK